MIRVRNISFIAFAAMSAMILSGCDRKQNRKGYIMTRPDHSGSLIGGANEHSNANMNWAKSDPDMKYDKETGRVVDHKNGQYLVVRRYIRSSLCSARIYNRDGTIHYEYKLQYRERIEGRAERVTAWEVLWALRGADVLRPSSVRLAGIKLAQHDSLERLGMFLFARRFGIAGHARSGDVVIVDRRMEDTDREGE